MLSAISIRDTRLHRRAYNLPQPQCSKVTRFCQEHSLSTQPFLAAGTAVFLGSGIGLISCQNDPIELTSSDAFITVAQDLQRCLTEGKKNPFQFGFTAGYGPDAEGLSNAYCFNIEIQQNQETFTVNIESSDDSVRLASVEKSLDALITLVTSDPFMKLSVLNESTMQAVYWIEKLTDARPLNYSYNFHHYGENCEKSEAISNHVLNRQLTTSLNSFCATNNVSLFNVVTTVFTVLMMRYTSTEDVLIGTIASPTNNPICLRTNLGPASSFSEALEISSETVKEAFAQSGLSFDRVLSAVKPVTLPGHHPLFSFVLVDEYLDLSTVDTEQYSLVLQYSTLDDGSLKFCARYNSSLFLEDTILFMLKHMETLLSVSVANPLVNIRTASFAFSGEHDCINKFNVEQEWPEAEDARLLHKIFEEAAEVHPDKVVLSFVGQDISYRDLNKRANQLANWLVTEHCLKPDEIVCLYFDRGIDVVVALLAVLKSGAAFCPIDIEAPLERVEGMLADTHSRVLLTDGSFPQNFSYFSATGSICVVNTASEHTRSNTDKHSGFNLLAKLNPINLAYILFTSGTTGKPKGVAIEHRNVFNTYRSFKYVFPGAILKHLAFSSYTFDMFLDDLFLPFSYGGTVVIERKSILLQDISVVIKKHSIESVAVTPSVLGLISTESSLKFIFFGGEGCSRQVLEPWLVKEDVTLINGYGPTETACVTTAHIMTKSTTSNDIGLPLSNCSHYVLDPEKRDFLPIGCIGELYIGGAQVGREYLGRPDLTEKAFVPDPFRPGQRMYKTGDLARMHSNGHVEILGRIDHQVKLRGYRIELGEIESVLLKQPGVSVAAVIMREDEPGNQYLAAYLVKSDAKESEIGASELKAHCSSSLLPYMIPTAFVWMETLPVTANGKLDKRGLPIPEFAISDHEELVPLEGEIEHIVASVWSQLLNTPLEAIGRNSNFFALGGNSLLAGRIISKLNADSRIGQISFLEFMSSQSLQQLCVILAGPLSSLLFPPVVLAKSNGEYSRPSSISESRLFVYQQQHPQSVEYNSISYYTISNMSLAHILQGVSALVSRHEALRTQYRWVSENIFAFVANASSSVGIKQYATPENIKQIPNRPFDLGIENPARFYVVPHEIEGSWTVAAVMHHICYDGACMPVFERELQALCTGNTLPPVVSQYGDFASWENKLKDTGVFDKQQEYWKAKLENATPLPYSFDFHHGGLNHISKANEVSFVIEGDLSAQLNKFAIDNCVTRFTVMAALFNILMMRYTGVEDICIGTFAANRQMEEFSSTLGFFINNICLRTNLGDSGTFLDAVRATAETVNGGLENQNLPFEQVISCAHAARLPGRHPIFGFILVEQETLDLDENGRSNLVLDPFQMLFQYSADQSGKVVGSIAYDSSLFLRESIELQVHHLKFILGIALSSPSCDFRSVSFVDSEELHGVIHKHNVEKTFAESNSQLLHKIFENTASLHPERIALEYQSQTVTYSDLNAAANRLANYLTKTFGELHDHIICLFFDRGIERIVAMLAVLKAGGCFCPIDIEAPVDRVSRMISDTDCRVILSCTSLMRDLASKVLSGDVELLDIEELDVSTYDPASVNISPISSSHLVYCLFTSGTTGQPKGVLLEHRNVFNYVSSYNAVYPGAKKHLAFAAYTFDMSVFDAFVAFGQGATLVQAPKVDILTNLSDLIVLKKIDSLSLTPSSLVLIELEAVTKVLTTVSLAGEPFSNAAIQPFIKRGISVINIYGPTEAGCTTATQLQPNSISNDIGHPLHNCRHYVLRANTQEPVAYGCTGELFIGGIQVGRGYLNRPDLTEKAFVPDPFRPGQRMYKTGDLARMHSNGHVEILGRIDHQVKLRGYRIELGEIESVLLKHPGVSVAAVIMREDEPGNQYLAAYLVKSAAKESEIGASELKAHCSSSLLPYMIPTAFVWMETLPVTANGKLDKRALPPAKQESDPPKDSKLIWPRNAVESLVHATWCRIFGVEKISIVDDFFDDMGGHSLLAARIINALRSSSPEYSQLSIADIMTHGRSIEHLAKILDSFSSADHLEKIDHVEVDDCGNMASLPEGINPSLFLMLQILGILVHLGLLGCCAFAAIWVSTSLPPVMNGAYSVFVSPVSAMVFGFSYLLCTILVKWSMLQVVNPGDYPIRGFFHLRWWMANLSFQIAKTLLLPFLRESQLLNMYLRALGFKVGKGTIIDTVHLTGFDCIEIGDFSFVGDDSTVLAHQFEVDRIRLVKTYIGSKCITGVRSMVNPGVVMPDEAVLGPMSSAFGMLDKGGAYIGSPAISTGPAEKVEMDPGVITRSIIGIYQPLCLIMVVFLAFTAQIPGSLLFSLLPHETNTYIEIVFSATVLGYLYSIMYALQVVVLKWALVQQSREGEFELGVFYRMRRYLFDRLVINFLHHTITAAAFQGSILLPLYLRLLGSKINWKVWLADIGIRTGVDLVTVEEGVVMGGENLIYSHTVTGNKISFKRVVIETHANTGNSVVVLPGSRIGRSTLIGDLALVQGKLSERSVWIGSPCIRIQQLDDSRLDIKKQQAVTMLQQYAHHTRITEATSATVDLLEMPAPASVESTVFNTKQEPEDSTWRTVLRELWILILKFTMFFPEMITILIFTWSHNLFLTWFGTTAGMWLIPVNAIMCIFSVILCIWFVKRVFIGKFIGSTSVFSFKFLVWTTYGSIYAILGNVFLFIQGTALLPAFLRLMGSKIGKNVYMEGIPPIETDQLEIGDDAIIMDRVVLQPHVIDHATLQFARIYIGEGVVMEPKSSLQALSTLSKGSKLKALSFVMKGETIPEDTVWAGNPSKFVGERKKVASTRLSDLSEEGWMQSIV